MPLCISTGGRDNNRLGECIPENEMICQSIERSNKKSEITILKTST